MRTGVREQIYSRLARRVNATAQAVAALVLVSAAALAAAPGGILPTGRCDPGLTRLFAPLHPRLGRYEVCATSEPLPTVAAPEWRVETMSPLDAFGSAGTFDRAALSRLYGGRQATVARGWREADGEFQSLTLVSPYPDPTLTRLEPGTLIIRFTL